MPLRFSVLKSALLLIAAILAGCSSVDTQKPNVSLSSLAASDRFQVLVRTGNPVLDKLVYEMAFQQFGGLLPLRERPPYTGTMELTFASAAQGAYMGSTTTIGSATASGGWYTGSGYIGGVANINSSSTSVSSGGSLIWQNSTMLVVLKRMNGERLWSADYSYKGGWELSGFVVNTPEEAARLVIKRLKDQLKSDFGSNHGRP